MSKSLPAIRHRVKLEPAFLQNLIAPIDRLTESIFSILILLMFTLAFWIFASSNDPDQPISPDTIMELAISALGAVIAYGMIDGVVYVLLSTFGRGQSHRLLMGIQAAETEQEAVDVIAEDLDDILEPITDEKERQELYSSILTFLRNSQPRPIGVKRVDVIAALTHILVAIMVVTPSLIPLVFLRHNPELAILVSNLISFFVLFYVGYRWGKYTGANAWMTGLIILSVILALVLFIFWLGG